jgi:hypothetical protein
LSSGRARRRHQISGNGTAAFIPEAIRASCDTARLLISTRHVQASKLHGASHLPMRNEADFEEWRQDAAYHAAKYARWDRKGERRI